MNVVAFDDAPFPPRFRGSVPLVGVLCAGTRVDGVLLGRVRADGADATRRVLEMIRGSQFAGLIQAVLLQGIAVAGFNVLDVHALHEALGVPVMVVARRRPNLEKVRRALTQNVPAGARKWKLIERAGPGEMLEGLFVQRVGLDARAAARLIRATRLHGKLPEPVRVAHLIAGAVGTGKSRGRA